MQHQYGVPSSSEVSTGCSTFQVDTGAWDDDREVAPSATQHGGEYGTWKYKEDISDLGDVDPRPTLNRHDADPEGNS